MNKVILTGSARAQIASLVALAVGIAIFTLILVFHEPVILRPISLQVRYGFTLAAPLLYLAVTLLLYRDSPWGNALSFAGCSAIFGLLLLGLWASGQSEAALISGLLPVYDALSYYRDALNLYQGFEFSVFSSWRPVFPAFLAGILGITGWNLQAAIAILVFLAGAAIYLLARQVRSSHGALVGAFVFVVIFFFYRRFGGSTLSENLGLLLGCAGFALLWRCVSAHHFGLALAGLFTVSAALITRPGPFLILPFLLLWAAYVFRGEKCLSLKMLALGAIVIAAAYLVHDGVLRQVSGELTAPFGNFARALYGTATGGNPYTQALEDHPELLSLPANEQMGTLYRITFDHILRQPGDFARGAWRQWSWFFSKSYYNAYSYFRGENQLVGEIARWSMYLLCLPGLVVCLRRWRDPYAGLALGGAAGVLLSVPFVPPADAFGVRLYAAGIPAFTFLPAMGIHLLVTRFARLKKWAAPGAPASPAPAALLAGLVLVSSLLAPAAICAFSHPLTTGEVKCPNGQEALSLRYVPGTFVRVEREDAFFLDWMPEFHQGRFTLFAHNLPGIDLIDELARVQSPATLVSTAGLKTGRAILLVAATPQMPQPPMVVVACGYWSDKPNSSGYGIFFAESINPID